MIPRTISDFRSECRPSGDQLNYKDCPVCGSTAWKVFVDLTKGKWVCFGGRHPAPPQGGYPGGNLRIEGDDDNPGRHILDLLSDDDAVPEWGEMELPEWHGLTGTAGRYLIRRGVQPKEAYALGLVEWCGKFRILFPYFDAAGQLVFWTSRRYSDQLGEGPKYLTAPGRHPLYEPDLGGPCDISMVVIVEGVFDAIAVQRAGYYTLALGGKSLPRYLENILLTTVRKYGIIKVFLDRDAMPAALRVRGLLETKPGIQQVEIRLCPHGMDPGDMTPEQIREVLG